MIYFHQYVLQIIIIYFYIGKPSKTKKKKKKRKRRPKGSKQTDNVSDIEQRMEMTDIDHKGRFLTDL